MYLVDGKKKPFVFNQGNGKRHICEEKPKRQLESTSISPSDSLTRIAGALESIDRKLKELMGPVSK
jgi:hypothetical protein